MSNGKGHFGPTKKNELTGESGPPAKVVPTIPVGPNRHGQFHLISNRNFRNFVPNGKRAGLAMVSVLSHWVSAISVLLDWNKRHITDTCFILTIDN